MEGFRLRRDPALRPRAAGRLRQSCEPGSGARRGPRFRVGDSRFHRRRAHAHRAPIDDRIAAARVRRRRGRMRLGRAVDRAPFASCQSAEVPVHVDAGAGGSVLLFGFGAALVSALLFGIAPVRQAFRANTNLALRGGAQASGSRGRAWPFREALLAVQVALCCVLVTACFVAVLGARRAFQMPVGIAPRSCCGRRFRSWIGQIFARRRRGVSTPRAGCRRRACPGVSAAAIRRRVSAGLDQSTTSFFRPRETDFRSSNALNGSHYNVSPGYLRRHRYALAGRTRFHLA